MSPEAAVPSMPLPTAIPDRKTVDPHIDVEAEIDRLRKERNAVILAHYYQDGVIQDLADYVGDSLGLSQQAAKTDADVIARSVINARDALRQGQITSALRTEAEALPLTRRK